jgi:uncharacterized iron-regulated membrane protein
MTVSPHDSNDGRDPAADLSAATSSRSPWQAASPMVAGPANATLGVVEAEVTIATPDGSCDAAFVHPATGAYPGVLIWPDAFGLRPSMRAIGRRLAAESYAVLVPNPFYRIGKAPMKKAAPTSISATRRPCRSSDRSWGR